MEETLTTEAEEVGALSTLAGRTGRLLRHPKETPQRWEAKREHQATLRRRPVVRRRREPATS